jgi:hypothetical protein
MFWAHSSAGRAVLLQSKGQEFESPWVHKQKILRFYAEVFLFADFKRRFEREGGRGNGSFPVEESSEQRER